MGIPHHPYYQDDLAQVHHRGFGHHAELCAPGILQILAPVRERRGLVLEIGCGTGLLTKKLTEAGHRVFATDASPAMLEIAAEVVGSDTEQLRRLTLPDDPLPEADAIVAIGHPINYLDDLDQIQRALVAMAEALHPGGTLAIDVCDLEWGVARRGLLNAGFSGSDWAIITEYSMPSPDRFIRDMTTFLPNDDGSWHRSTEHHENVLVETATIPPLLAAHGVEAQVRSSFGTETLPTGLRAVVGTRTP